MSFRDGLNTFRGHEVPRFRLIDHKKWWFALSGFFIALSLLGLLVRGLTLSIDFKGGALLQYPDTAGASVAAVEQTMAAHGRTDAVVQLINGNQLQVRTRSLSGLSETARSSLLAALAKQAGITPDQINEQDVGPTWGAQISQKALQGLIVFLILVSIYIALRFDWKMAVGAQAALVHDLIITAGIYALVGREVTPETVIAILTILGYSLYDTVVIYDKVKENTESQVLIARDGYSAVVNMSLNQTLMRSVNTSLVVLLPILSLLLFGGETLKNFAFALFVGVASGTYSSIFIAAPLLSVLKEREPKHKQMRARMEARAALAAKGDRRQRVSAAAVGAEAEGVPASAAKPRTPARRPQSGSRPKKGKKKAPAKRKRR